MFNGCDEGANLWVEIYFHDCIYNTRDLISFVLGLCSILFWVFAQMPQFISNIQNQSAEALSPWFLAQWFLGDTLNLFGCLVQGQQLPTTTYLAMYFVLSDVIMLMQFIYYNALTKRRERLRELEAARQHKRHRRHHHHRRSKTVADPTNLKNAMLAPAQLESSSNSALVLPLEDMVGADDMQQHRMLIPEPEERQQRQQQQQETHLERRRHGQTPGDVMTAQQQAPEQLLVTDSLAAAPACKLPASCGVSALAAMGVATCMLSFVAFSTLPSHSSGGSRTWHAGWLPRSGSFFSSAPSLSPAAFSNWSGFSGAAMPANPTSWLDELPGCGDTDGPSGSADSPWWCDMNEMQLLAGTAMGYASTCMYLGSRVSQIFKNASRKSAEGLSLAMFCLAVSANLCTGCSITLRLEHLEALKAQLPWICGAFGTVGLDITIARQAIMYARGPHHLQQPLLGA